MAAPEDSTAMADDDGFRPRVPDRHKDQAKDPNSTRAEKEEIAEVSEE
jgi:hypothetical protein